jgi:NAD(P)-dependent dehydrogenase (short-subunit alcohol dehydrogenase family)
MNVECRTALITGANRGLGRTLAAMLVQRGARKVYVVAREPTAMRRRFAATSMFSSRAQKKRRASHVRALRRALEITINT